jgi:hypothetical protein
VEFSFLLHFDVVLRCIHGHMHVKVSAVLIYTEGVIMRSLQLRVINRRGHKVYGSNALWHIVILTPITN